MKPSVTDERRRGFGIVVITARKPRTAKQQFSVLGNSRFNAGQGFPNAARTWRIERIQRRHATFGEPVSLDQRHADGRVEFGKVRAERSRSRCRYFKSPSKPLPH